MASSLSESDIWKDIYAFNHEVLNSDYDKGNKKTPEFKELLLLDTHNTRDIYEYYLI